MLIDDAEVHEQMRRHLLELEVAALNIELRLLANRFEQRIDQATGAKSMRLIDRMHEAVDELRQRHQARARTLVQALHQREHLVLQHARHQPFTALFVDLVQCVDRHADGDPVLRVARLVQVARRAIDTAEAQNLRERRSRDAGRLVPHQFVAGEEQQLRLALAFVAIPALEARAAEHVGRQLLIVKRVDQFIVDQHVLAARLVLELFDLRDQLAIGCEEGQ